MKNVAAFILILILVIGLNYKSNLNTEKVNTKIIEYFSDNNDISNYSYNYIDEKNIVIVGLKENTEEKQKQFLTKIFDKQEVKTIKNKKMIKFEQGEVNNQRIIMVNDKLYYDTGKESTMEYRCGNQDGSITSNIANNQIPKINDQANFEGNYSYQYGEDNTIELYIDSKWIIFKQGEEK